MTAFDNSQVPGNGRPLAGSASRVKYLELMDKQRWDVASASYTTLVVGQTLVEVAGKVESIQGHIRIHDTDADFRFKILTEISYDGVLWTYAGDVSVYYDTNAPVAGTYRVETAITDSTDMGRHIRFLFLYKGTDASATYATISALVAVKFVGQ